MLDSPPLHGALGLQRAQLRGTDGIDSFVLAGHRPAVVVDLAQVICEVGREMYQVISGAHLSASYRLGKIGIRIWRTGTTKCRADGCTGRLNFAEQPGARHIAPGKLRRAIPDIAGLTQCGADVMLKISCQVENERAGDIRNPWYRRPEAVLVRVGLNLALQRAEITIEYGGNR